MRLMCLIQIAKACCCRIKSADRGKVSQERSAIVMWMATGRCMACRLELKRDGS